VYPFEGKDCIPTIHFSGAMLISGRVVIKTTEVIWVGDDTSSILITQLSVEKAMKRKQSL